MSVNKDKFKAQFGDESEISKALKSDDYGVNDAAHHNATLSPDHITHIINHSSHEHAINIHSHPNANAGHVSQALDHKDEYVRRGALNSPHVNSGHIEKALDNSDDFVRHNAAMHDHASSQNIDKALRSNDHTLARDAMYNQNLTPTHIDKALDHPNPDVRSAAILHKNLGRDNVKKILDGGSEFNKKLMMVGDLSSDNLDAVLDHTDSARKVDVLRHPNVTKEHIEKAAKDSDPDVSFLAKIKLRKFNK